MLYINIKKRSLHRFEPKYDEFGRENQRKAFECEGCDMENTRRMRKGLKPLDSYIYEFDEYYELPDGEIMCKDCGEDYIDKHWKGDLENIACYEDKKDLKKKCLKTAEYVEG